MVFFTAQPLLALAIILIAGLFGGWVASKLRLPSVTGQILAGILIGHTGFSLFDHGLIDGLRPVTHFALGLIALTVGSHLHLRRLRNAGRRLFLLIALEAVIIPFLVFFSFRLFANVHWTVAAFIAAICVSTAPATTVAVVRETRAKGVFVKTLIAAVALNNIVAICLFETFHAAAQIDLGGSGIILATHLWLRPLTQIGAAALVGIFCGLAFGVATPLVVKWRQLSIASLIMILLTWGVASALDVSPLMACLFLGITLVNFNPQNEHLTEGPFAQFEAAILAAFFTLAGIDLNLDDLQVGGALALFGFSARFAGKYASAWLAMKVAHATDRVRRYLGLALIPQAGVSIGLVLLIQGDESLISVRSLVLAIALAIVTLNELIGPVLTRISLTLAGETKKDRPRVIDFLHEENIVVDFKAKTKEEAIEKLTQILIKTNHLKVDSKKLLRTIMEREKEMSTCIGDGVALPHGVLETGDQIVGAMALSQKGLPFATPDHRPIHCMVLLATPPAQRDRHLEALAAISRAITSHREVQDRLFHAKTPAHAYDLLHAEEAEDFNYFLKD